LFLRASDRLFATIGCHVKAVNALHQLHRTTRPERRTRSEGRSLEIRQAGPMLRMVLVFDDRRKPPKLCGPAKQKSRHLDYPFLSIYHQLQLPSERNTISGRIFDREQLGTK
jgi:hypothetical protein